jgi:predicted small lipoprotein YifL
MSETRQRALGLSVVIALGLLGLAACGGGGPTTAPKVQSVIDAQQAAILINIRAGFGPASWVLLQLDEQNRVYNVFENRNPLQAPASGGRPDLGTVTSDPNNWDSYARNTVTVLGSTTALTLDNGSVPNTYTVTPQALSDFVSGNANLTQTAWNEIAQK